MATAPARFAGIPVAAYRDNSVKRVGNSRVIAFCRVGSATGVECLSDGKLCKRIINHVEAVGLLQAVA